MQTNDTAPSLARLFGELIDGVPSDGGFVLNTGDVGMLKAIDGLSAAEASRSVNEGGTIAAHAQHVRYGLSLMNQWAVEGGDPFANAKWDEAWTISTVDAIEWDDIRGGLRDEAHRWLNVLRTPRELAGIELTGMVASIVHLAYHLGAIRQIHTSVRGPKNGTFP